MNNLEAETDFFREISIRVRQLVSSLDVNASEAQEKVIAGDYVTHIDLAVEKAIVDAIEKQFQGESILAEEEHSATAIGTGRIWIIDPICGTSNLGRGINNFCTNIALAQNREVIASCVVDHSNGDYYWSTGAGKIYVNDTLLPLPLGHHLDTIIDLDYAALAKISAEQKAKHNRMTFKLLTETTFRYVSLNTSLGFAYTAIGKLDGFTTMLCNPWDIAAAAFLIKQSGGVITDLAGKPWQITSCEAIAATTQAVHDRLLSAYLSA